MKTGRKNNNSGFSLVELIIVIAIMGVAPIHYIPDRQESPEMCGRNCDNTGADQSADPRKRTESGGVRYQL